MDGELNSDSDTESQSQVIQRRSRRLYVHLQVRLE
jgi:hypothetical protein